MIRHVRRHFICFTMCILTGAVLLPMIALNAIPTLMSYNQNKTILQQAVQNEIRVRSPKPDLKPNGQPSEMDPFTVTTAVISTTVTIRETTITVTTTNPATETAPLKSTAQAQTNRLPQETTKKATETKPPLQTYPTSKTMIKPPLQTDPTSQIIIKPPSQTYPTSQTIIKPPQSIPNDQDHWQDDSPPYDDHDPWQPYPWNASISLFSRTTVQKKWNEEPPFPKESNSSDYFLAVLDKNGNMTETIQADWYAYTEEEVQAFVQAVQKTQKKDGRLNTLQFYEQDYQLGSVIGFIDCSKDQRFLRQLVIISIIIFILMESIVLFLTMMLTKRAMQPMQISFEKQKQFISDAGHELKTPLTIISANADILQDEIGENKWLNYIRIQTERMRVLVDEMMALTKMEYNNHILDTAERFDLSAAVETMALPFESQAFEQQKKFLITVQPDLYFHGNSEQIRRMIGILIDNAFKYSAEHGEIKVSLREETNRAILEVYNTGKGIREEETEKIFERFYRSDSSRARATGGYGLGLSIAKSVAEAHKIKIEVNSVPDHWITFTLIFPPQKK